MNDLYDDDDDVFIKMIPGHRTPEPSQPRYYNQSNGEFFLSLFYRSFTVRPISQSWDVVRHWGPPKNRPFRGIISINEFINVWRSTTATATATECVTFCRFAISNCCIKWNF